MSGEWFPRFVYVCRIIVYVPIILNFFTWNILFFSIIKKNLLLNAFSFLDLLIAVWKLWHFPKYFNIFSSFYFMFHSREAATGVNGTDRRTNFVHLTSYIKSLDILNTYFFQRKNKKKGGRKSSAPFSDFLKTKEIEYFLFTSLDTCSKPPAAKAWFRGDR